MSPGPEINFFGDLDPEALCETYGTPLYVYDASTILDRLENAKIANARLNSVQQFVDHPQLRARDRWREVDSTAGLIRAAVPPATIAGIEPRMDPIPDIGEHTDAILRELGYDPDIISTWRREGIV